MARLTAEEKARIAERHQRVRKLGASSPERTKYLAALAEMDDAELEQEIRAQRGKAEKSSAK